MATSDPSRQFAVPSDPDALIPWLNRKRESGRESLPERQMKLNLAFFLGEQWLVWDETNKNYARPKSNPADPNAPIRVTANKIGAIVEHFISRLLKANPEPECRPVGDTPEDVDAAKVGTRILVSENNRLAFQDFQMRLYFWVVPLGWSFAQVTWDPEAGEKMGSTVPNEETPEELEDVSEGQIDLDIVPGFELSLDPGGRRSDLDDSLWACRTVYMTPESIWERWGVTVKAGDDEGRSLAQEVFDLSERAQGGGHHQTNLVAVHQFWLRPSRTKAEGLVVTWAGDTILEDPVDYPYEHGKLPFIQWDLLPGLGTREGRTWVKDLIPLQADYNDARSREATLRRTLTPKLTYPTGSIDPRKVTTRVEMIPYNPIGQPPHWEIPDGRWMAQYEQALERADNEMGERSGQNDINGGDLKSSMPAAAILALQEADDTKLAIPAKLNADAVEQYGQMILALVRQFWTEDRVVRTWSQDGFQEVKHFSGADIAGQLDVHVSAESALPRSKSARAQLAMELRAEGLLPDPRKYVRMLDIPGVDLIVEDMDLDAKQQKRELDRMLEFGEQIPVNPWDNHLIHWNEVNNYRKTEDYEKLRREEPNKAAVIDAHAAIHQEQMMTLMMAGATPGASPDQGGLPTGGGGGPLGNSQYLDPMTGKPAVGTEVAAGNAPSALTNSTIAKKAGIGGPGQPGPVPGVDRDTQAASMGS